MDETIYQNFGKTFFGDDGTDYLVEEGQEEFWRSEKGWARYLDEQGQSYNMNPRPSLDPSFDAPDLLDSPVDVLKSFIGSIKRIARDPADYYFPSLSNDMSGARSWGGGSEVESRNHKPPKGFGARGLEGTGIFGWGAMEEYASDEKEVAEKKRVAAEREKKWNALGEKMSKTFPSNKR
jgi:hypothetical protein